MPKLTGAYGVIGFVWAVWVVYLLYKVAVHVSAWPFN